MAQPQRLSELLSGWQVDPAHASAAQAKAAEEFAAALRKAEAEYDNFTAKGKAARAEVAEGLKSAGEGMTSLFRGIAVLSASSQKDLEKSAQALAKFEAVLNVLKGITFTVHGSTKAWEAYRTAVLAAASAEAAAARTRVASGVGAAGIPAQAASSAGLVTGGSGIVLGSATATLGAFVAAVAGAAFGLKVLSEQFDGSAKRLDSWTAKIGAAEASAATKITSQKDSLAYRAIRWTAPGRLVLGSAEAITEDSAAIEAKTGRLAAKGAARDSLAIEQARMAQEAEQRRQFEQGWIDQLRRAERESSAHLAGSGLHGPAREVAQTKDLIASNQTDMERASPHTLVAVLNEAISLQKQLESATRAEIQEKLAAAREALNIHRQDLQTLQQKMQMIAGERSAALGALSSLDPGDAPAMLAAIRKARAGKSLSLQDAEQLQRSGLSEFRGPIESVQERRVAALGLAEAIKPLTDALNSALEHERELKGTITLDEKLTISLEKDDSKIVQAIENAIRQFLVERDKALMNVTREATKTDDNVQRAREGHDRRTRGG